MTITIRPIQLSDAESYHTYRCALIDEPNSTLPRQPGEYPRTLAEERARLEGIIGHPNQHILVAVDDGGKVVGQCACRGSSIRAMQHCVGLGIDVARPLRGQGVGSRLMAAMLAWARDHPLITRVELDVFAHNHRAIGLYLKYGFAIEGRKLRAYIKDGQPIDAYIMGLLLE